jgi:hypothetical protein
MLNQKPFPRISSSTSSILTATASNALPPRFFQLDSSTLQTGLEERMRDALHSSVSPLVSANWMEEFRALVEIAISSACFGLGLMASASSPSTSFASTSSPGFSVGYGDQIYNLRYIISSSATSLLTPITNLFSSSSSSPLLRSQMLFVLLSRLIARFAILSIFPVVSRLLQRRYQEREDRASLLLNIRRVEKVLRALDLLNHVAFLYSGQHRHIVDRLLGIRLASGDRELSVSAHTYLIDRQHYWQTVFAALSLFLPMLNLSGWAKWSANLVRRAIYRVGLMLNNNNNHGGGGESPQNGSTDSTTSAAAGATATTTIGSQHRRTLSHAERFECLVCHTAPMAMPRRVRDCGHVCICYYCSQTAKPEACPECHGFISGFEE